MHSKVKGLIWIAVAAAIMLLFVLALPKLAKHVPWSAEEKIGSYLEASDHFSVCGKNAPSPELQKLVTRLHSLPGDDEFPVEVRVIEGKTVNAFAMLGGKIYVYDGLLQKAESPDELAGVLAHEMEHIHHRHILQGVLVRLVTVEVLRAVFTPGSGIDPSFLNLLINLRFSRDQEAEADQDGLKRLQAAHVNVMGFADFFKREENTSSVPALLSDHPASEDRFQLAQSYFRVDTRPVLSAEEWKRLKGICR